MSRWRLKGTTGWLAIVVALAAAGCGGEAEPAVPAAPAVDPRFASADALLAYYNVLTVDRPILDPDSLVELFYAENQTQERLVRIVRSSIPLMHFGQALWERFGETLDGKKTATLAPNPRPAYFTENGGERALALEFNADGSEKQLYLVRVGERWWVSGYTIEYDPEVQRVAGDIDRFQQTIEHMSAVAAPMTKRVRAGEFDAIQQVRAVFGAEMVAPIKAKPPE